MAIDQITEILEKRRADLVRILESGTKLELEKQHQMYGAINEIDLFLQTLSFYEKNSTEKDIGPIKLVKPPVSEKGLFTKIFEGIKGKVLRNK